MRDLILKMSMSLDGFVSDADGRNAWMFGGDAVAKAWSVETIGTAGLHIMGSRTFRAMAAHWPTATDAFAGPMNRIPKTVFTRQGSAILDDAKAARAASATDHQPGANSWADARIASGDLADEIARLKAEEGPPIMAHGGAGFARSLVAQQLVDAFVLLVHPVALGRGEPLFSDLAAPLRLTLTRSTAFPGGAVAQVYRPT